MPRLPRAAFVFAFVAVAAASAVRSENDKPAPAKGKPPTAAEIDRLIGQLAADDFNQREAASKTLQEVGVPAWAALAKAATVSDAEVRRRADDLIELLEPVLCREVRCFRGHSKRVSGTAFSPDGKLILSGSHDGTVRLWQAATGNELRCFRGHTAGVTAVAFSPDGKRALSGSRDHTLRLWDVETGSTLRSFQGHADLVWSVAFSPDGKWALSGSHDKTLRLWEVETGKELRMPPGTYDGGVQRGFQSRRQTGPFWKSRPNATAVGSRHGQRDAMHSRTPGLDLGGGFQSGW